MIATVESTELRVPVQASMPPSGRDFEVYEFVVVRCCTTREAAAAFGISQTRVRQVLARVVEFLIHALPADDDEHSEEQKLAAAQRVAGMRLDFLYCEAMETWRRSQEPTLASPVALGKVCYLNQAMRIALAAAKVPMRPMLLLDEGHEPAPAPSDAMDPPVRDCSENGVSRGASAAHDSPGCSATSEPAETYRSLDEIKADARRAFLRPAQAVSAEPGRLPDRREADATIPPLLSRKERRRRERLLARATKP